MINLGRHRGLFYASRGDIGGCPRGWLFIAAEDTPDAEHIRNIVGRYRAEVLEEK